ncbi:DUF3318 domain-containing protein [Leptolyngbya sp. 7M]|uniref:DUF3318 domain-containing protein n=1 Tax=Leptolyngbya sp. 7M TaxID=2812896 RepID=UPI001B8BB901|nr:DUF3318 domain-containing protein [Leptolyngbya sp. 7M]QYO64701.1 DUF3318 domain-containing protein [Leptolyngbya sp. 7M]
MVARSEISRLLDLMPASGRMYCKIVENNQQPQVIAAKLPRPGQETRPIQINFDLWNQLTQAQQDLLLLHTVSWLLSIQWFKPTLFQGLAAAGAGLTLLELLQINAAGAVTFGTLTALAVAQIWRQNRSDDLEITADEKAIQIAQRRGYSKTEAAQALAEAITAVARLEGRPNPTVTELIRCQTLQAIAAPAPVGVTNPGQAE